MKTSLAPAIGLSLFLLNGCGAPEEAVLLSGDRSDSDRGDSGAEGWTYFPKSLPAGLAEVAYHGVPNAEYQRLFLDVAASGYRPVWVDGFEVASATYFNVVFRPSDGPWAARHNLSSTEYQT